MKTLSTHVITTKNTIAFFPTSEEAFRVAAKRGFTSVGERFFTLDGMPPNPGNSRIATFHEVESYCDAENVAQTVLNFH